MFLVLTLGKLLAALGNRIGTGSVFCPSFLFPNNVSYWLVWVDINCTMHVVLSKQPINQFKPVWHSRQQALKACCTTTIHCDCGSRQIWRKNSCNVCKLCRFFLVPVISKWKLEWRQGFYDHLGPNFLENKPSLKFPLTRETDTHKKADQFWKTVWQFLQWENWEDFFPGNPGPRHPIAWQHNHG